MSKYELKFWFEHGGTCIWGRNNSAKEKYGYAIDNEKLPVSKELINKLNDLEKEYVTYLDWNEPQNPSPWSEDQKKDFLNRANTAYQELKSQLGEEFEVINDVESCVE